LQPSQLTVPLQPKVCEPNGTLTHARFPPGTIRIRNAVQQQEMEKHGQEIIDMFGQRSPQNKELLAGVVLRPPT
jgi:hypothetical protein